MVVFGVSMRDRFPNGTKLSGLFDPSDESGIPWGNSNYSPGFGNKIKVLGVISQQRILMLVGDFVENYEVMVSFQMLLMVGHEVHAVCLEKKAGEVVTTAVHDFEGGQIYTEQ